jgi:uncharacterized protein (TIGR00251 family)
VKAASPLLPPFLVTSERTLLLHLHIVPGAARSELAGSHGDRLKVRIKAPPSDGAANRELVRFLADLLDLAPSSLEITRGASDRRKTVRLPQDLDPVAVASALAHGRT